LFWFSGNENTSSLDLEVAVLALKRSFKAMNYPPLLNVYIEIKFFSPGWIIILKIEMVLSPKQHYGEIFSLGGDSPGSIAG